MQSPLQDLVSGESRISFARNAASRSDSPGCPEADFMME
jgi:hypothetical protein